MGAHFYTFIGMLLEMVGPYVSFGNESKSEVANKLLPFSYKHRKIIPNPKLWNKFIIIIYCLIYL